VAAFSPSATGARPALFRARGGYLRRATLRLESFRGAGPLRARDFAAGILTAVLAASALAVFGPTVHGFIAAVFAAVLVVISAIDIERRIIPNKIVLPATGLVLLAQAAISPAHAAVAVAAGLAAALVLYLPLIVYPAGMGMGDVKLALLLGAALGKSVTVALVVGLLAPLPVAVALLTVRGPAARKAALPFGPFLALGGLVALFFGDALLAAYAAA
jgi:leader peptidase (prepilin peptidase)/N-methyltransferase